DDRFNNQIAVFNLRKIVVKVSRSDERSKLRHEERRRLCLHGRFQPIASNPSPHLRTLKREPLLLLFRRQLTRRNIEQQRRHAGIREVRGNLRPHSPRPQHRRPLNPHLPLLLLSTLPPAYPRIILNERSFSKPLEMFSSCLSFIID